MKAKVEITADAILISDEDGEIVSWKRGQWIDDSSIVPAIANAILISQQENGAEELWNLIHPNHCFRCGAPYAIHENGCPFEPGETP